ncbi:MAG: HD domain-containing protein [Longimicrobiales bacterium]
MLILRDPLWDTIRLDEVAVRIVDSAAFQRLRYIKQLGLAHLVYPGATHSRFDHALGVYHLMQRALAILGEPDGAGPDGAGPSAGAGDVAPADHRLVPLAGLLHDIGHYPFSHAVEELEEGRLPGHHEAVSGRFLDDADVRAALESVAPDAVARIEALIRGRSDSPLQGLVSGPLDLDKIEYLKRDARFSGVPYGEVDVDRLLHALVLLEDPGTGRLEVGVHEKGVAALESLLFAKYQMFRNVYWHHAVRAATVLYKRIVDDALDGGMITGDELVGRTDEGLLALLEGRAAQSGRPEDESRRAQVERWVTALRSRRLPKRVAELPAAELGAGAGEWLAVDSPLKRRLEERLAVELEVDAVFVDFPEKRAMFGLDLLVRRRSGEVLRLGPGGHSGLIGLPRVSDELYRSARVLRVFAFGSRLQLDPGDVARLVTLSQAEVAARLEAGGLL